MAIVKKVSLDLLNETLEKLCKQADNRYGKIINSGYIDNVTENDIEKTYLVLEYIDSTDTKEHKLKIDITDALNNIIDDNSKAKNKTLSANKIYELVEEATDIDLSEYLVYEDVYVVGYRYVKCLETDDGAIEVTEANRSMLQQDAQDGITLVDGDFVRMRKVKLSTLFFKRDEVLADPDEEDEELQMKMINEMMDELIAKYPQRI